MIAPFLWQHRIIAPSAFAGYFSPIRRFEKLDVHKARLHFSNLASTKNLSTNALAEWCGAALFIMLGIRNEKLGLGRHWCVCRGGACPARPRSGKRTAKSIGCTAVSAVPPDVSLRGGRRPTWRPEREARGSALGVQSRSTRLNRGKAIGEIAAAFPRLPRPLWGLAMTHQGSARCTSALTRLNCPVQGAH